MEFHEEHHSKHCYMFKTKQPLKAGFPATC